MSEALEVHWSRVSNLLRDELGEATYKSWLKQITFSGKNGESVILTVPTRFVRDWIVNHYMDQINSLWRAVARDESPIELKVGQSTLEAPSAPQVAQLPSSMAAPEQGKAPTAPAYYTSTHDGVAGAKPAAAGGQAELSQDIQAALDPRFTFDNFVVGKSNELAYAASLRVAESDTVAFNPLYLYGGVGLGKTHLMHAIAWHIRSRDPSRRVVYMSAERFMYQFIRALRYRDTVSFKETFRSVDVLMIDDVQFIAGKDSTQEEFFHTFNALVDQNRQIIISGDRSPTDLEGIEERLRSRLGWGLVADVLPTDFELRLGILQAKNDQLPEGVKAANAVLEFLAHRITSNVRELEGALNRVAAYADLVKRNISVEMVQEVLQDLLRANDRKVTVEEIQKKVAEHFNIRVADMHSARRSRAIARPRQIAMFLCKQLTTRSLPEIGKKFGGRDHTTVIHAVRKVEELCHTDSGLNEDVVLLSRLLGN